MARLPLRPFAGFVSPASSFLWGDPVVAPFGCLLRLRSGLRVTSPRWPLPLLGLSVLLILSVFPFTLLLALHFSHDIDLCRFIPN